MVIDSIFHKFRVLAWCLSSFLPAGAVAVDLPKPTTVETSYQVGYCQSDQPITAIDSAIRCDYQLTHRPLTQGFGESQRWIRIKILEDVSPKSLLAIEVRPYFLREINFYKYSNGQWVVEKSGSQAIENQKNNSDVGGHHFITSLTPENQNTFYLQIKATSIAHISISVDILPNLMPKPSEHLLGIGAQIGILTTILVFSLASLIFTPSAVMVRFSVYMVNLILCLLAGSGIIALYVLKQSPIFNELLFFTGLCMKLGLWVWLAQSFLLNYKTPVWYKASCFAVYGLVFFCILLGYFQKIDLSIFLILIGYTATSIIQIAATIRTPNVERTLRIALILGFGFSIAIIYFALVSVFFPLMANSQIPLYLTRLTDFVNPLVMLSIIVFKNKLVRLELVEARNALTETQLRSQFERQLLKDRRTLIDMLTHELKNPLTSIGLAVETLSQSIDRKNINDQKRLKNINRSIVSMDAIIERCNLMNLIDQQSFIQSPVKINLYDFFLSLFELHQCEKYVDLIIDKNLHINADPQYLQIIFNNLIENGLKYSIPEGRLKLTALLISDGASPKIRISVANTAQISQMPDETLIFERFYRHPMAQKIRGSGLGLYICKELCGAMGGSIKYRHIENEVIFDVELPQ